MHTAETAFKEYLTLALKVSEASWNNDTLTIASVGLLAISRETIYDRIGDGRGAQAMYNVWQVADERLRLMEEDPDISWSC